MSALLLTGATGFVGMEVLACFVESGEHRVFALVRAQDDEGARERVRQVLVDAVGDASALDDGRVVAVRGDVERSGLGIPDDERARLAGEVDLVLHSAASVAFTLPLDEARQANVEGIRNVVAFARECQASGGLRRLAHVSTAYVAGDHEGRFGEEDLAVGQEFRNTYEQTKYEAERVVRAAAKDLPVQVLRPSIVVGERDSGWTGAFNVLYGPLKAFARGTISALPGRRSAPVDVVPVDYVADAVHELVTGPPSDDRTFHLVAGQRATTVGRLIDLSAQRLGRARPLALDPAVYRRLVHPLLVRAKSGRGREALERLSVFFPYLDARVRYDDAATRRRLEPAGVRMTPLDEWYDRLVAYAERADWGRRALTRAQARRERSAQH